MTLEELQKLAAARLSGNDALEHDALLRSLGLEPGAVYQELEMTYPYVDARQDISYTNADVSLHSHTFYEIICCQTVPGVEYLVGSERYRLQAGDIILIAPGVSHRPMLPEKMGEAYRRTALWINPDFMKQIHSLFPVGVQPLLGECRLIRTYGTQWNVLADYPEGILREIREQPLGWQASVIASATSFIVQLYRAVHERSVVPTRAEKPELLDRVISYIESNLDKKITLSETAQLFFVSESTISQTFRNKLGVSFYRCVIQRRLIAAKTLIAQGITLEAVATQVGFSDYSAFYRAFKQEYGISPRQYRNLML